MQNIFVVYHIQVIQKIYIGGILTKYVKWFFMFVYVWVLGNVIARDVHEIQTYVIPSHGLAYFVVNL